MSLMREIVTHILSISNFIYCYIHNRLKLGAIIHHFIDFKITDQYTRENHWLIIHYKVVKWPFNICTFQQDGSFRESSLRDMLGLC